MDPAVAPYVRGYLTEAAAKAVADGADPEVINTLQEIARFGIFSEEAE